MYRSFREIILGKSKESVKIEEETVSGDIATVDSKLGLYRRPCKIHPGQSEKDCKICKLTESSLSSENATDKIRSKYKIREIIKTKFGTQIDLFQVPDIKIIKELLKDYKYIIDSKSIFIYS